MTLFYQKAMYLKSNMIPEHRIRKPIYNGLRVIGNHPLAVRAKYLQDG